MNATADHPEFTHSSTADQASVDAILKDVEEFIRHHDQRELLPLLGTLENFMTSEELNEMRSSGCVHLC